MRAALALIAGLSVLVLPAVFTPGSVAQVTLDLKAIEQSPNPATPTTPERAPAQQRRPAPRHAARKPEPEPKSTAGVPRAPSAAPAPRLPTAPPPTISLAPIVPPVPAAKPQPAPPAPVSDQAGGGTEAVGNGIRVLFSPERADLAPETEARIKAYIGAVPRSEAIAFSVIAYAAGTPSDPSTPRRLSLARALAVRSVLLAEGVPSEHIYVRALGATYPDGPSDRVDLTALGPDAHPVQPMGAAK